MKKFLKISMVFLLLSNISLFANSVLGDLTTRLDKCVSFEKEVKENKALDYDLFIRLNKETKQNENYIYPVPMNEKETVRLYVFLTQEQAYAELKNLLEKYTVLEKFTTIFPLSESKEQVINLQPSIKDENTGFNCYIKKNQEVWIASYPYGGKDREGKKVITIIEGNGNHTKMFFYKKNTFDH
ncbi:hypothetical protein [Aliarcobacter vitoriensis]|uniref:Uncharacterized protein n=1 Tax=Aliarcobacter vitoriensis TaxID=2011099 RepID=A0A366MR59_9BACT|nr:hypothetical protein [Aliarcobacter vitoriensis]RBQ27979.1 hypothetical protein CRU91_11630 [Aliarcobacter vitoriensis]